MAGIGYTELSGLEQHVMSVLWTKREATAREIRESLPDPLPAYRTVTRVLSALLARGMVSRIIADQPRRTIYLPVVSHQEARAEIIQDILSRLFAGSPAILIRHLLETDGFTKAELESIRQVLDRQERAISSSSGPSVKRPA